MSKKKPINGVYNTGYGIFSLKNDTVEIIKMITRKLKNNTIIYYQPNIIIYR